MTDAPRRPSEPAAGSALPELREADAPAAIAAIYADMRAVTGLPLVNLIYRHLATMPGCLEWVWGLLRPRFADHAIPEAATLLRDAVRLPELDALVWPGSTPREALRGLARILDIYNRGNSMNVVALRAVLLALEGVIPIGEPDLTQPPVAAAVEIPPLPKLAALDADTAAMVRRMASRHRAASAGVIPSLYLHVATWPTLLPTLETALTPLFAGQELERARIDAYRLGGEQAAAIAPSLRAPGVGPDEAWRDGLGVVLDRFTQMVIPEMIPVGLSLARALQAA